MDDEGLTPYPRWTDEGFTPKEVTDAICDYPADQSGELRILTIGSDQLMALCTQRGQEDLCRKPGQDIRYLSGHISGGQWLSGDPLCIDALLIQSRGYPLKESCNCCSKDMGPFVPCVRLPGHYGGICANCLYLKRDAYCSLRDNGGENRKTCTWEHFLNSHPISTVPIESWHDSALGSSPLPTQPTISRTPSPGSCNENPILIPEDTSYACALEIIQSPVINLPVVDESIIESIEEPAGTSMFNPILISDSYRAIDRAYSSYDRYEYSTIDVPDIDDYYDPDYTPTRGTSVSDGSSWG